MRISEVSKKFGLSNDTLRYYESIGLIPNVNRNENGIREYDEEDLRRVDFVVCMRRAGLPIKSLQRYFKLLSQGDSTLEERRNILVNEKNNVAKQIEDLQATFQVLEKKIENYDVIIKKENAL